MKAKKKSQRKRKGSSAGLLEGCEELLHQCQLGQQNGGEHWGHEQFLQRGAAAGVEQGCSQYVVVWVQNASSGCVS